MNIRSTRRQGFAFIDESEPLARHPQIRVQTMIWEDKNEADGGWHINSGRFKT